MTRDDAARALGLSPQADAAAVRSAFALCAKANHPDHGGDGAALETLQRARDIMLIPANATPPCALCKGMGYVRRPFGVRACIACATRGDRR